MTEQMTFSILGDSISTYEGYVPRGYPVYYMFARRQEADLATFLDTWWGQVLSHFDGTLMVNDSWSGSLVTDKFELPKRASGCSDERTGNLGAEGQSPDNILVFMGTNDCGWRVPLQSDDKNDMTVFENAYEEMLRRVRTNHPDAHVYCLTLYRKKCTAYSAFHQSETSVEMEEMYCGIIRNAAEKMGCRLVELHDGSITVDTIDGLHPNRNGMTEIANAVICEMEKADGR